MPPADLSEGNVSLSLLRAAVAALVRAPAVELHLMSVRPDPADMRPSGVAYHVFGTTYTGQG